MILLLDIGNTHTHLGLADPRRVKRQSNMKTSAWFDGSAAGQIQAFLGGKKLAAASFASVVPRATRMCRRFLKVQGYPFVELTHETLRGVGIQYPRPETIGPDRLANAIAVTQLFGAPAVVVDFGTAVTFDVVNREGEYCGGIIAPGLSAMTDYLHEKTALLPRIQIRETAKIIGKSTEEAMLIGAVHGYRGLVRGLIQQLKRELGVRRLPVIATGGYAELMARNVSEITKVEPDLTLEGLRLIWLLHQPGTTPA